MSGAWCCVTRVPLPTKTPSRFVSQCNIAGLILYHRALEQYSSVLATASNNAANIVLSGLLGRFFFREDLPINWWMGASCMMLGTRVDRAGSRLRCWWHHASGWLIDPC